MVERWSSKPCVWVRFLLPLLMNYFKKGYKTIKNRNNFFLKRKKNIKTENTSRNFYPKQFGLSFYRINYKKVPINAQNTYLHIPLLYSEPLKFIPHGIFKITTDTLNIPIKNYRINLTRSESKKALDSIYTTLCGQNYLQDFMSLDYRRTNDFLVPFEYFIHQQNSYHFIQINRHINRNYSGKFTRNNITSIKSHLTNSSIFYQSFSKSQNMILLFNKYTTHLTLTSKLILLGSGLFYKFVPKSILNTKSTLLAKPYYKKVSLKLFKKLSKLINRYKRYTSSLYLKPYNINKFRIEKLLTYKHNRFSNENRIKQLGYSISKSPHLPSNVYKINNTLRNVLSYQSFVGTLSYSSFFTKQINLFLINPFLLKFLILQVSELRIFSEYLHFMFSKSNEVLKKSNILPSSKFSLNISKKIINTVVNNRFKINLIPWYHNTLIRFIENFIGKKVIIQFYPYMEREVSVDFRIRYKL